MPITHSAFQLVYKTQWHGLEASGLPGGCAAWLRKMEGRGFRLEGVDVTDRGIVWCVRVRVVGRAN